jgi:hypothetical protein
VSRKYIQDIGQLKNISSMAPDEGRIGDLNTRYGLKERRNGGGIARPKGRRSVEMK